MIVKSNTPLSDNEKKMIQGILTEANCVNEAMRRTFPNAYTRMDRDTLYFGNHSYDYTYEITPTVKQGIFRAKNQQ